MCDKNSGNTYLSVNLPYIQLLEQKKSHRLLHLHKNVPGILAQINKILADSEININGQYLKTNDSLGYVITDVDKKYDKNVLEKLWQLLAYRSHTTALFLRFNKS